ncbi:MAG: ABC transporter transmembrane domain-containing protein, partial [Pyrinomonadaceae bacterium]
MHDLRKFALYFRPYRKELATGVLCIFASVVIGLLVPVLVGRAVDDLRADVTWGKITRYALTILGVSALSGVFLFLQRRILIGMSRHVEYDIRRDFYAHLQRLPLSFYQSNRIGDLMARATNDLGA